MEKLAKPKLYHQRTAGDYNFTHQNSTAKQSANASARTRTYACTHVCMQACKDRQTIRQSKNIMLLAQSTGPLKVPLLYPFWKKTSEISSMGINIMQCRQQVNKLISNFLIDLLSNMRHNNNDRLTAFDPGQPG